MVSRIKKSVEVGWEMRTGTSWRYHWNLVKESQSTLSISRAFIGVVILYASSWVPRPWSSTSIIFRMNLFVLD